MRTAGMLQYPPAMYHQIEKWAVSIWCGHVASQFAHYADGKDDALEKAIQELESEIPRVHAWWKHVKGTPNQSYSFKVPERTALGLKYTRVTLSTKKEVWNPQKKTYVVRLWGGPEEGDEAVYEVKGIPTSLEDDRLNIFTKSGYLRSIDRFLRNRIDSLEAEKGGLTPAQREFLPVYREALKYTTSPKAYAASARRVFPVDLTGWKYGQVEALPITVKLNFVGHVKRGGQWSPDDRELQVDMPDRMPETVRGLETQIWMIQGVLQHELRHVAQTTLQQIKGLKSVGVPTRVPSNMVSRHDLEHAIRPIEFYPRLGDEVSQFLRNYPQWTPSQINRWVKTRDFFQAIKKHKPDDWRKAVKVFVEQVQNARRERLVQKVAYKSKHKVKDNTVYEYSDRQVTRRHNEKAERLERFRGKLSDLREQVKKDLKSTDLKVRGLALAVALVDHTYERIGNPESAKDGHFGVTGWQGKHLKFQDGNAILTYVGKSGVKHRKTIDIKWLVEEIRKSVDDRGDQDTIVHDGEKPIKAQDVNEYLKKFEITAKDLRGLHANILMQRELRKSRVAEDKREDAFAKALDTVSDLVGHLPATLRNQYLVPGLEDQYLRDGTVSQELREL